MPDQDESLRSDNDIELAWRMRLNLLMRDIRVEWASASFGVAFRGIGGWLMRWSEFAGSDAEDFSVDCQKAVERQTTKNVFILGS